MDTERHFELCERLWQQWIDDDFQCSKPIEELFSLDAAPEPYLIFGSQTHPLCVLTTNPGASMSHQLKTKIKSGESFLSPHMEYFEAARRLGAFYSEHLGGTAAARVASQNRIATDAGFSGVLQVECVPWHSARLPRKSAIIDLIARDSDLTDYLESLKRFLASRPTMALSAVSSRIDLGSRPLRLSPWLRWQANLLGVDPTEAHAIPLVKKDDRITSLALLSGDGEATKAVVLMMGGNHFPSESNCRSLVEALRSVS